MNFSSITQIGRLVADVELCTTSSGTEIATFTLATNYGKAENEEVCYIDILMFGKQAQLAKEYLEKGKPVLISGRLTQDKWEDKQTGQKRSKHKIIGNNMVFLGSSSSPASGHMRNTTGQGRNRGREPGDDDEENYQSRDELPF